MSEQPIVHLGDSGAYCRPCAGCDEVTQACRDAGCGAEVNIDIDVLNAKIRADAETTRWTEKYWRERQSARAEVEDLTLDLEVANATIERVTLVGSEHPHADTCAMELSPNEDYECSCWRSALEAALVPHAD